MLRSRVIPCLLVKDKGLVKTINFKDPKYVGDPINTVKIFNEKEVDELIVLDISATANNHEPDMQMIKNLAIECRMPLCYGGGITKVEQAVQIVSLGVEKVALSSAAIETPTLLKEIAVAIGSQSVAVVLDIKKHGLLKKYSLFTHNGTKRIKKDPVEFAKEIEKLGVGEIVINSIDNEGTMKGYDYNLISKIRDAVGVPITVLGGAGTVDDLDKLIKTYGIIGAGAGSFFVFKGPYRAVLISYNKPVFT